MSLLDTVINSYIRLSPDTITALAPIHNKIIAVELTDWNFSCFMIPYDYGIQILADSHQPADTKIISTLASLMNMVLPYQTQHNSLHIEGDVLVGQKLHQILSHIDIDWEEHLSSKTSDSFAHTACSLLRRAHTSARNATRQLGDQLVNYLQIESELLATTEQIATFKKKNFALRNDLERLEARINHFIFQQNKMSPPDAE